MIKKGTNFIILISPFFDTILYNNICQTQLDKFDLHTSSGHKFSYDKSASIFSLERRGALSFVVSRIPISTAMTAASNRNSYHTEELILTLIGIGYVGTDFIEGLVVKKA